MGNWPYSIAIMFFDISNVFELFFFVEAKPWSDPEEGTGGTGPLPPPNTEKSQKYRVSLQYWSDLQKSQSYQTSIQCWAIVGPPAKRHLNGVTLAGRGWPDYSGIWILSPIIN